MSVLFVEKIGEYANGTGSTTQTITTSAAAKVGDLVIVAARVGQGFAVSDVSDSAGNTWVILANSEAVQTSCNVWYSVLTSDLASSSTITITATGSYSNQNSAAWSFRGITRPSTTSATNRTTTAVANTVANVTPSQYGSLLFSAVATAQAQTGTPTVSTGWTTLSVTTASVRLCGAYAISTMDSLGATWTPATSSISGAVSGTFTPNGGDLFAIF